MRVGGPYKVSVELSGCQTETMSNLALNLGVRQDLSCSLRLATVSETVEVVATVDATFNSSRTGAATSVNRDLDTTTGGPGDRTGVAPISGVG